MARKKQKNKCGKRTFHSLEAANRALLALQAKPAEGKVPLRTYHCHRCGGFHLTSKEYGYS